MVDYDPEEAAGTSAAEQPTSSRGRYPSLLHNQKPVKGSNFYVDVIGSTVTD